MKTNNFFSKAAVSILIVLCLAMTASQAYAEPKIDSVSDTLGVMGQNLPITIRGSGFDANTRVSMSLDVGNMAFIKGSVNTGDGSRRVEISGNTAYVSTNSGVTVLDISNPAAPSIVSTMGNIFDIRVVGNKAYFTQGGVFKAMDMSDPKYPKLIGSLSGVSGSLISVTGNKAYLKTGEHLLQIIDVSNPSLPSIIQTTDLLQPNENYYDRIISVIDDKVYAVEFYSIGSCAFIKYKTNLSLIDVSNPSNPQTILLHTSFNGNKINNIQVLGNKIYLLEEDWGLTIIDISDPVTPKKLGTINTSGQAHGLAVINERAYIADGTSGLQIVDVEDPLNPKIIGFVNTPGNAYSVAVTGNTAYVADDTNGLQIVDIGKIFSMNTMGFVNTPYLPSNIKQIGNMAYLLYGVYDPYTFGTAYDGLGVCGIKVIDTSNPLNSFELNTPILPFPKELKVRGNTAFIFSENDVLDVCIG